MPAVVVRRDGGDGRLEPTGSVGMLATMTTKATRIIEDLVYAEVDGHTLALDLLLPAGPVRGPLVCYIHGGGWQQGSKANCRADFLVERGFAMASIAYRFSHHAVFPAQIHDCKAAIRWLRAHAGEYDLDADTIVAAGGSAGATLAVLLGVSADHAELEGDLGDATDRSSAVQGVVNWFGPMDFPLRGRTNPQRHGPPDGPSWKLLGGELGGELERLASPVSHVDDRSPPLLTLHGLADQAVLPIQATRVTEAYAEHRRPCELHLEPGAVHGDQALFEGRFPDLVEAFLDRITAARA